MIRRGKQEGWLNLPTSAIKPWAQLNGIATDGITVGAIPGCPERGSGVVAARNLKGGDEGPLMVIPSDLVLSLERVEIQAKADESLRDVLAATGPYARVGDVFFHCRANLCFYVRCYVHPTGLPKIHFFFLFFYYQISSECFSAHLL
jgi:hypothetical protein